MNLGWLINLHERGHPLNKKKLTKMFSIGVILLFIGLVLYLVFGNQELGDVWAVLGSLNKADLALCVACYAGFVLTEGIGLWAFLRMEGFKTRMSAAIHFSFAGIFYANITPSSTGGQPMQVYLMTKEGVSGGVATSALTVRYFFNQLAIVVLTAALWIAFPAFVDAQLGSVIGLVALGWTVNMLAIPLVILVMLNQRMVEKVAYWGIALMVKMRLCKRPEHWKERAKATLDLFHGSLFHLVKKPWQLLWQFLLSMAQVVCLMMVPALVYRALGLSGTPWYHLLTVACMLFVSASYTPLPGASGAQEGGFLLYFRGLMPEGTISIALLVWRFMTYYLCLIVGAADQLYVFIRKRLRKRNHREEA